MKETKKISKWEKILHWLVLLSFLGLVVTALGAEYFFSKEALMDSFHNSLAILNITIAPADQFFMSRIARRDTWDIHLYFGFAFSAFTFIWLLITLFRKNNKNMIFKIFFFSSVIALAISGIWMWLRLYHPLSEENFGLLKKVHHFAYWTFIYTLLVHIAYVIYLENSKKNGVISNMFRFKNIKKVKSFVIAAFVSTMFVSTPSYSNDDLDMSIWSKDKNFIDGLLYLEGKKGYSVLIKTIANCPYDKCKVADKDDQQYGVKNIEIKEPDFKKGIKLLSISSGDGNPLASEKLLKFLRKRIDYKSHKPNGYLVKTLKKETGLTVKEYRKLFLQTMNEGLKSKKSCMSEFVNAESFENGIYEHPKDLEQALEAYKQAATICPQGNLFKILAKGKVSALE